ncbi:MULTISPECIES: hypothetical protein [Halobacterium]|uniref:Uncharacterized protein n=1 Tax=Halobacterium salinarum (strain ATCC 33171 / DSM 3754 / JCM 8978 / NBRC 102687 / NCIMB 764 / 91-R6) TaxID=2597657 RepID=A0A4D6GQE0_HALS9|nr:MULTISPECIES: hypothetical protein [Halobacterium]MDL0122877.1 hypothetical protein [Halobacterium salinarum]MDL0124810.1 hypothetical protein [Halobacterium salinarum]MDL0132391.1 hypothetical protein [Halobacterium salinarum]MDL0141999.1 hypothetical protein [Halobacterium salinarum]MDL0143464.1 hypothetical protein [Halobacterium salinarum]
MAENLDPTAAHRRSLTVTTIATLGGVVAAFVSEVAVSDPTSRMGLLVLLGLVIVELGLMRAFGVDIGEFSAKDYFYVAFMTFALWFVTWGVLLTAGVSL